MSSFESVAEITTDPTVLWKTRKWHWMSGDSLPVDLNVTISGSGSVTVNDNINGGYLVTAGFGGPELNYNLIRHLNFAGSVWLGEVQLISTTAQNALWGMTAVNRLSANFNGFIAGSSTTPSPTNWRSTVNDGATNNAINSSVAFDALIHSHKLELTGSNGTYKLDDILLNTHTTNLPTTAMQPIVYLDGVTKNYRIRQMEAYNT